MLGNFVYFLPSADFFFKIVKKKIEQHHQCQTNLKLVPNYFQWISADDARRIAKYGSSLHQGSTDLKKVLEYTGLS